MFRNPTVIGEYIEVESRDVRRCPSYYAADWEVLRTKPGRYPLIATFDNLCADPYYVGAKVDADRIEGKLYSGFGGLNFASTDLPPREQPLHVQVYGYELSRMVESGRAVVSPEFQKYVDSSRIFLAKCDAKNEARRVAAAAHRVGEPHDTNPEICNTCWAEGKQAMWDAHRTGQPHNESACDHCKAKARR